MARTASKEVVRVGNEDVPLSHLDKLFFPPTGHSDGITKGDLVGYYRQVAPRMLGYLKDRPLVMERYPDGIGGERIVQKNAGSHFPDWITRAEVPKQGGTVLHVIADKPATLVYLANQASIEFHVFLSRLDAIDQPDQIIFDLDPPDAEGFGDACRTALRLRGLLEDELGLAAYVKTTGGKGLHVHLPIRPGEDFDPVRDFARGTAEVLAARYPDELTTEPRKNQRGSRLYLDVMRNAYAQTAVAPFAVRARPGAPVATPLDWAEVGDQNIRPRDFTIATISERPERSADPWAGMSRHRRGLSAPRRRLADLRQ
ncbi:MAG TPA: non-homologous end-joining DNA ligase [Trebonia sp.]|jgi:bifunctional non-homologous end joining protein LigD